MFLFTLLQLLLQISKVKHTTLLFSVVIFESGCAMTVWEDCANMMY